jgi:hypothetical protein
MPTVAENGLVAPEDVATYFGAVEWLLDVLGRDEVARAWLEPSALTRYSTGGIAAHAVQGGILRLEQLLLEPEPTGTRRVDIPEFFGPNRMASVDDDDPLFVLLRAGAEDGAGAGPAALLETARQSVTALEELLPATPADRAIPLVRVPDGQVPLSEYLRTRVLEVVVHGDDVVASIDGWHPPDPPEVAVDVCLTMCLQLARARAGGVGALRAFTRAERAVSDALRVL